MVSGEMKLNNYIYLIYPVLIAFSLAWAVTGWLSMKTSADTPSSYNLPVKAKESAPVLPDTELILTKNIFGAMVTQETLSEPAVSNNAPAAAASDPGFDGKLIGTVTGDDESIAVLQYKDKNYILNLLEENEGLMLVEVGSFYAVITKGGERYKLLLKDESKSGGPKKSAIKINESSAPTTERLKISRKDVIEKLSDVNSVIKSVLIVPFERNGNFEGYRVRRMTNTSVLKQIGVQRNDVIMRLNGKSLESPTVFFDALKNAENLSAVSLDILRSGKKMTLYVEIEG